MPSGPNDGRNGRSRGTSVLSIASRVKAVHARVEKAAALADRDPTSVRVLAASKTRTIEEVDDAHQAGIRCFGENYVQPLIEKISQRPQLEWHFIGHLQRNKAKKIVNSINLLHTLDSTRLADTLDRYVSPQRNLGVLIQVNIGDEATKSGCSKGDFWALAEHIVQRCPRLQLKGLMTIPPPSEHPEHYFGAMHTLKSDAESHLGMPLPELSMGMSSDLDQAIASGATIVRVGTAVFGPRTSKEIKP